MRLQEWMDKENKGILWLMGQLDVSSFAIKKWIAGQRTPRQSMQQAIFKLTDGKVSPNDWILEETE